MCEAFSAYAAYAAAAVSAYSGYQSGRRTKKVNEYNAREAENTATDLRNKGIEEENKQRQKTAELISKQRAALGASGVDIDSGSAADLQQDTELLGEVDALKIRRNYTDEADATERKSVLISSEGQAAQNAATLSSVGSLLDSSASVSSKWYTPESSASIGG